MKFVWSLFLALCAFNVPAANIGDRLEPFFDDHLIGGMTGDVALHLHRPTPREVVLVTGEPWEGNTSAYYTIFKDGDKYRMYYRGADWDTEKRKAKHREVTCYAESKDGINWLKPKLGLFEFNGSKQNNIVWDGIGTHCFTVFKDANPNAKAEARYKAISRGRVEKTANRYQSGLFVYQSPDGINWKMIKNEPVILKGAFDSQNLAFYDTERGLYVDYHRWFNNGLRDIMTCTSKDYVNWTEPVPLRITEKKKEHLYTNAIQPYDRAPHLYVGFPTRYLPKQGSRVEPVFMSSRDGLNFNRWSDPVIPESAPKDRKGNRSNYMAWGLFQLPGKPNEYSVYASEAYYEGPDSRLRRFSYRVDGFVSVRGGAEGGKMTTKPIQFAGKKLVLNYAVKAGGFLSVQLRHPKTNKVLAVSKPLTDDKIAGVIEWKRGKSVRELAGQTVRVEFQLKNADLYSMQFVK
ncbi:MAG: hypothetical protein ACPGVU_06830 [Limisphaerales bacterium]